MTKNFTALTLLGTLSLSLAGCGGVKEEAKVATAVQTMMVLAVEASIAYNTGAGTGTEPIDCAVSGTYQPSINLASLVAFLTGGGDTGSLPGQFTFTACKMRLCGETITLNGTADFVMEGELVGAERQITVQFEAPGDSTFTSTGIIDGNPAFDYTMRVNASGNSLSDIDIESATIPLEYSGKTYRASEINALARGC